VAGVCEILHQNKYWAETCETDRLGRSGGFRVKKIIGGPAETLAQRGFRESGLRKIWFSKNLDTKI
jgi:hypothetical protein